MQAIEEGGSECGTPSSSHSKYVSLLILRVFDDPDPLDSSPVKVQFAGPAEPGVHDLPPVASQIARPDPVVERQQLLLPQEPAADQQIVDDLQREMDLQYQRQQQEVVSAAMQAMGALPPNAVFKVTAHICAAMHATPSVYVESLDAMS